MEAGRGTALLPDDREPGITAADLLWLAVGTGDLVDSAVWLKLEALNLVVLQFGNKSALGNVLTLRIRTASPKEEVGDSHNAQKDYRIEEHVMSESIIFTIVVHNNLLSNGNV